jgi:hypothetical protein
MSNSRQALYGQIQLGERVSTHKLSSPLKRFRASWVSTRQWTRTVLNSSMNLSSSSALSVHKWEIWTEPLNLAARFENWSICIDTASISTSSHSSARWECDPFQLQAEDLGLMTCCGGLLRSCDRGTYCTLENLVWQRL